MLEVRNIAFSYRRFRILRDVSFSVPPGGAVAVVGPNGAGKTTLLKILATLMAPESGKVFSDGSDASRHPVRYRSQLGYMPESPALYEDMNVKSYLKYRARLKGEPEKRIRRRLGEAAELCMLGDFFDEAICRLSFGQKKRVALADALLLRPRVLLLDDVLAGLDLRMREAVGEIVASVSAFSSVVVTGHEIADIAKWASRVLVLRDGSIASDVSAAGVSRAEFATRVAGALKEGG